MWCIGCGMMMGQVTVVGFGAEYNSSVPVGGEKQSEASNTTGMCVCSEACIWRDAKKERKKGKKHGMEGGEGKKDEKKRHTGFNPFLISLSSVPPLIAMTGAASGSWAMGEPHSEQNQR